MKKLKLREWLELGQAMCDKSPLEPKYFRKHMTKKIVIGDNIQIKVNGKTYKSGEYVLANRGIAND